MISDLKGRCPTTDLFPRTLCFCFCFFFLFLVCVWGCVPSNVPENLGPLSYSSLLRLSAKVFLKLISAGDHQSHHAGDLELEGYPGSVVGTVVPGVRLGAHHIKHETCTSFSFDGRERSKLFFYLVF